MTYRTSFDDKLSEIKGDILRMGGIAGEMARLAVDALLNSDIDLALAVVGMDDEVDRLYREILQKTMAAVGLETPVAGDLRMLVSTLGITGEIEKTADDAVKLARRSTQLAGHFPAEMKRALMVLGEVSRRALASALKVYSQYDAELAERIVQMEEQIDGQYVSARNRMLELIQQNPAETEYLVRTIDAFHALEHIADHAVEIAARVRLHNSQA